jgi:hypothetical protein
MHWEKASNLGVRFSQKYNVVLVGICIRWLVAPSFSYTYSSLSILATIHTFCHFFDMIARLASVSLTVFRSPAAAFYLAVVPHTGTPTCLWLLGTQKLCQPLQLHVPGDRVSSDILTVEPASIRASTAI